MGDAFGGWLTDKLLVKTNNLKFSRRSVAIVAMLGCGTFTLFAALSANPFTAVYCLTAAMFFLEMTIGPAWAVPMDIGGEFSGTVSGMMNMGGQFVGALSPTVFGYLVSRGSWVAPFGVSAGLLFVGAAIWAFWIDPEQSVIDKDEGMTGPPSASSPRLWPRRIDSAENRCKRSPPTSRYFPWTMYLFWYILNGEAGWPTSILFESLSASTDSAGREPVLEWLRDLDQEDRRAIGLDLMRVQFGWPVGMPLVRGLKDGLWEVRIDAAEPENRTADVVFPRE